MALEEAKSQIVLRNGKIINVGFRADIEECHANKRIELQVYLYTPDLDTLAKGSCRIYSDCISFSEPTLYETPNNEYHDRDVLKAYVRAQKQLSELLNMEVHNVKLSDRQFNKIINELKKDR